MINDTSFGSKKMFFMNTQKIPSNKTTKPKTKSGGMSSIPRFRGKTLDIAQDEENRLAAKKPAKKNNFLQLESLDSIQPPPPKRAKPSFSSIKGEDQTNFANENVMSKSNLRDRK